MKVIKKVMLVAMLVVMCLPIASALANEENMVYDYAMRGDCYEKTVYKYYNNTSSMQNSIAYVEGEFGGYLYYVSHTYENYKVKAKYQGVICRGYLPY